MCLLGWKHMYMHAQLCPTLFDPMDHSLPGQKLNCIIRVLELSASPHPGFGDEKGVRK